MILIQKIKKKKKVDNKKNPLKKKAIKMGANQSIKSEVIKQVILNEDVSALRKILKNDNSNSTDVPLNYELYSYEKAEISIEKDDNMLILKDDEINQLLNKESIQHKQKKKKKIAKIDGYQVSSLPKKKKKKKKRL